MKPSWSLEGHILITPSGTSCTFLCYCGLTTPPGHRSAVDLLVQSGAETDVPLNGTLPLQQAAIAGHEDLLDFIPVSVILRLRTCRRRPLHFCLFRFLMFGDHVSVCESGDETPDAG